MICYAHGSPLVSIGRRRGRSFVWNRPRAGIDVRHRTANCFAKQASSAWCSATGRRKGRELFRTDGSIIWKRGCAERLWSLMAARELLFHCERMGGKRPPRVIAFWGPYSVRLPEKRRVFRRVVQATLIQLDTLYIRLARNILIRASDWELANKWATSLSASRFAPRALNFNESV